MIDLTELGRHLERSALAPVASRLTVATQEVISTLKHGDLSRWQTALGALPEPGALSAELNLPTVVVGHDISLDQAADQAANQHLVSTLKEFIPWRKGPYSVCNITIDTEWRSDLKWERLVDHITPLAGRRVLDVGCGNGYHAWRMLGTGADFVVGIDPGVLFVMQFNVIQRFVQSEHICVLPLRLEQLPGNLHCFDTVFSMGVLYHRRDPKAHLAELKQSLAPAGELILETLVVPEEYGDCLEPTNRYARMRNVWQIPSSKLLVQWLEESGFRDIRVLPETVTTVAEQRSTEWMPFESLRESLEPDNPDLTIEGHPAPRRVVVIARSSDSN